MRVPERMQAPADLHTPTPSPAPRPQAATKRQQRGLDRMARILDAAVVVFARVGVDRATTNAIAEQAGISPGSLYQYYGDKAEIARAVGARYAQQITESHAAALDGLDLTGASMAEVLDHVLDPIVVFKNAHAAFVPLFTRTDLPESITAPVAAVEAAFTERIAALLRDRNPGAAPADVQDAARTSVLLFRGVVGSLGSTSGDAAQDLAEVKLALAAYFAAKGLR